MEWRHLPVAGGIYDQKPEFIERMLYLMQKEAEEERRKEAAENRKNKGALGRPSRGSRR